jgi:hypothetical protein
MDDPATRQRCQRSHYFTDDAVASCSAHPLPDVVVPHFFLLMQDWICSCVGDHQNADSGAVCS